MSIFSRLFRQIESLAKKVVYDVAVYLKLRQPIGSAQDVPEFEQPFQTFAQVHEAAKVLAPWAKYVACGLDGYCHAYEKIPHKWFEYFKHGGNQESLGRIKVTILKLRGRCESTELPGQPVDCPLYMPHKLSE